MSYCYETEKPFLFTDEGQRLFLKVRDRVNQLIKEAGAFRQQEGVRGFSGSSWQMIACIDRLVELGEIEELPRQCWTQYKIYSDKKVHNY